MKVDNEVITIVTVCDNQYCVMLAALLKSLEINSANALHTICVYIIDDGISAKNLNKLRKSIGEGLILKFIQINQVIADRTSLPLDSSSFPLNVYVRLFIPHFLPVTVHKVIYLDVDMITLTDISGLWMTPLNDFIIAAVKDRSGVIGSTWGGITNYEMLGLDPNAPYFNSGLLLIDIDKWRKTNLTTDVLTCITNNKIYANFPDQYGLNVVFANNWLQLDEKWNSYATGEINDPYIIHFIGRKPIFKSYNYNLAYRDKFFEFLNLTTFKNFSVLGEHHRLLKKFGNLFVKTFLRILKLRS
jgi:lipopolysaccharide biosynthesis glycosyltransferase